MGIGVAALALLWALARSDGFVEGAYARHVGFQLSRALSVISGVVPLSLAEIAIGAAIAAALVAFVLAIVGVVRQRRSLLNVVANGALRALVGAAIVGPVFYLTWGLHYARAPLPDRLAWPAPAAVVDPQESARQTEEIALFTQQLVDATNAAYRQAVGSDDAGGASQVHDRQQLDAALDAGYTRVQTRLRLDAPLAASRGRAKPLVASLLMNHLGLTGFYFPFTGEANYNRLMPAADLPHTIAHEKAHQRGIAREDEASFLGFLACIMSDDPYVRYSGYLFGQLQLLSELFGRDRVRARTLAALRVKGVQRDLEYMRSFWAQYEGAASAVSSAINNTYLRSQGDRRGIAAYAASRNLIVRYARVTGALVPPTAR